MFIHGFAYILRNSDPALCIRGMRRNSESVGGETPGGQFHVPSLIQMRVKEGLKLDI